MLLIVENSSHFHFEKHQPANIFVSTLVELKKSSEVNFN